MSFCVPMCFANVAVFLSVAVCVFVVAVCCVCLIWFYVCRVCSCVVCCLFDVAFTVFLPVVCDLVV